MRNARGLDISDVSVYDPDALSICTADVIAHSTAVTTVSAACKQDILLHIVIVRV